MGSYCKAKAKVKLMITSLFFWGLKINTLESTKINTLKKIQALLHFKFLKNILHEITTKPTFICSKSTMKTPEQCVKLGQS